MGALELASSAGASAGSFGSDVVADVVAVAVAVHFVPFGSVKSLNNCDVSLASLESADAAGFRATLALAKFSCSCCVTFVTGFAFSSSLFSPLLVLAGHECEGDIVQVAVRESKRCVDAAP